MENNNQIDIETGTISFWIKENQVAFNDKKLYSFVNVNNAKGAIFILKDTDNKIKFFYVYLGKGRTDIEWDCSKLSPTEKHMIVATWSRHDKEIKLYIDGNSVGLAKMDY